MHDGDIFSSGDLLKCAESLRMLGTFLSPTQKVTEININILKKKKDLLH